MNINQQLKAGFKYKIEHIRAGEVIDVEEVDNLIPTVGQNHVLNTVLKNGTPYAAWYVGIYEGNYTPTIATTMTDIINSATECSAYNESVRQTLSLGTVASGAVDNSASKAQFTMNATKTIYGGFVCSGSTKGSSSDLLVSVVKFGTAKSVVATDLLLVTASFTLTSS